MAGDVDSELETEIAEEPDLEDISEEDLLDEDALEDPGLDDDDDDPLVDVDDLGAEDGVPLEVEEVLVGGVVDVLTAGATAVAAPEADEAVDDDEDLVNDDDVEASLDVILKERLVVTDEEDEEAEDVPDVEERGDGTGRVLPKQPGEFVCQSCFLVKNVAQLADNKRKLCRDCV